MVDKKIMSDEEKAKIIRKASLELHKDALRPGGFHSPKKKIYKRKPKHGKDRDSE